MKIMKRLDNLWKRIKFINFIEQEYIEEYIFSRNFRANRCQELLVKIIRNNGRKFEIASKQTDSCTEECIYKYIEQELQLFCIIDRDRTNGCQESSVSKKFEIEANGRVYGGISSFWIDTNFPHEFVYTRKNSEGKNVLSRRDVNYKILETNRCCREDTFFAHPRLIRKQIASRRIHFHFGGHREKKKITTMANKPLPPGMRKFFIKYFHSLWSCSFFLLSICLKSFPMIRIEIIGLFLSEFKSKEKGKMNLISESFLSFFRLWNLSSRKSAI